MTDQATAASTTGKGRRREPARVRGIFERPKKSGIWWIRYADASGRIHREKIGPKAAAIALYEKRRTEVRAGRKFPESVRAAHTPTLAGFAQRFMNEIQLQCGSKPRTVEFYGQQLARLLDYAPLANARLSDIDEAMIADWAQQRRQQVSVISVNRGLATLRRALRLAQRWRVLDRVPQISLLKGEHQREFVLTREAEARYLAVCTEESPELADMAMLLLDTGLRVGEAARATWEDVSFQAAGYIRVREGKSRSARRAVPLTARVRAMLEYRRKAATSEWVFAGKLPGRPALVSTFDHAHRRARARLGMDTGFVIHSLRHTFCTRLGAAGADAFDIQRMAGHHSIIVSQRYVHPAPERAQLAIARLDAMNRGQDGMPTGTKTSTSVLGIPADVSETVDSKRLGR